jgi:cation transport regulator ChaC
VVTLVKSDNHDEDRVYGVAYEINSSDKNATFEYLNYREKCGYSLNEVIFYPSSDNDTRSLNCVCYFANPDNKYYSPNLTLNEMALHIHQSHGPSGPNKEYLFRLCESLKMLAKLNFVKNNNDNKNNNNNNNSNNNFDSNEKDADEILNKEILIYDKHLFELEALVRNL